MDSHKICLVTGIKMESGAIKPQLIQIIKTDQISNVVLIITALSWVLFLWTAIHPYLPETIMMSSPLGRNDLPYYLRSSLGITLLAMPVFVIRVLFIRGVFKNGAAVTGTIKVLRIKGSRGYIIYTYNHDGKEYSKTVSLNFTKKMAAGYREGGPIALAVKKNNPNQALIRDLYIR